MARWEPLEALSLSRDLDALSRGGLLHKLLEQAVQPHLGTRAIGKIAEQLLANNNAELWAIVKKLPESAPEAAFALAMLPPVFKEAALREIVEMAAAYFMSARDSSAKPRELEKKFAREFPGLGGTQVVGKVDRIDDTDTGPALLDYKSGKRSQDFRKRVKLGWNIQATLYPWLCNEPNAEFSYIFLGRREAELGDGKDAPPAETLLVELAQIVESGHFIPVQTR